MRTEVTLQVGASRNAREGGTGTHHLTPGFCGKAKMRNPAVGDFPGALERAAEGRLVFILLPFLLSSPPRVTNADRT